MREEKNEEEPYRCGCSMRKTRGSCGGWLDGENDGDEDDSPGFSAASPPPVTSCSSGCESFAEKSPARRENVGYARFLGSPFFISCNISGIKLDVGIGIGSDTDIQRLAVSGCRYRMSISETDTDMQ